MNEPTAAEHLGRRRDRVYTNAVTISATNAAGTVAGTGGRRSGRSGSHPLASDVAEQQLRDEEAGQHEEHVDADVAAGEPLLPAWKSTTRYTATRAQPVEVRPVGRCGIAVGRLRRRSLSHSPPA